MGYILVPNGSYDIRDVKTELQCKITEQVGKGGSVTLSPNLNALKCIMTITDYEVDLRWDHSIRRVLGFEPKIYKTGRN